MENKNDKCIMVIAYYKEKNNIPLFPVEKKFYKNLRNTYGNVEDLKDVRKVEKYLFANNYLVKKRNGAYTVSKIGEISFNYTRFSSEHKKRIVAGVTIMLVLIDIAISLWGLIRNVK